MDKDEALIRWNVVTASLEASAMMTMIGGIIDGDDDMATGGMRAAIGVGLHMGMLLGIEQPELARGYLKHLGEKVLESDPEALDKLDKVQKVIDGRMPVEELMPEPVGPVQ